MIFYDVMPRAARKAGRELLKISDEKLQNFFDLPIDTMSLL
jgi:hypothetical protein